MAKQLSHFLALDFLTFDRAANAVFAPPRGLIDGLVPSNSDLSGTVDTVSMNRG